MAQSSHPERKEVRETSGHFLQGKYSPARRSTAAAASIPPRASAYPSNVVKVRSRYPRAYVDKGTVGNDVTQIPTAPPVAAIWQYETPCYEAESSLSSLSLAISEAIYEYSPAIDEIDTTPPPQQVISIQDKNKESRNEHVFAPTQKIERAENSTASGVNSIAQGLFRTSMRHPFDRFRWWLLVPGRIELIVWVCGTIILICVTGLLAFIVAASMGFFQTGVQQNTGSNICSVEGSVQNRASNGGGCTLSTVASPTGLRVTMENGDLMETGNTLQLRGQGFHPLGHITIMHDGTMPCQPGVVQANERGEFVVALSLDEKKYWGAGRHQITVSDTDSKHSIILTILLDPQK